MVIAQIDFPKITGICSLITSTASVIIAACSLAYTIWHSNQVREQNRVAKEKDEKARILSLKPILTTWTHRNIQSGFYHIELINCGVGPAEIESFKVFFDGKIMEGKGTEPLEKAAKELLRGINYSSHFSYFCKGYWMAPKDRIPLAVLQFLGPNFPTPDELEKSFGRVDIEIEYKTIYGEPCTPFTTKSLKIAPQQLLPS